jgi:WD40 repeat protein
MKMEEDEDVDEPTDLTVRRTDSTGASNQAVDAIFPTDTKVPRELKKKAVLTHGQSVSSIGYSSSGNILTTGGKGIVKMWDTTQSSLDSSTAELPIKAEFECIKGAYIRSCKLTTDEKLMVVCGESKDIVIVDLATGAPRVKAVLSVSSKNKKTKPNSNQK